MIGTKFLENRGAILLAADTLSLGAAGFLNTRLSQANFTPSRNSVLGDFTEANFDGYAAIITTSATVAVTLDPLTGDWILYVPAPAGGWLYTMTGLTIPSQTIYGAYVQLAAAGLNLLGCIKFPTPRTLNAIGNSINLGTVSFRVPAGYLANG